MSLELDPNCLHTTERIAHCELELGNIEVSKQLFNIALNKILEDESSDVYPILEKIY
jgi:hypothetical protein